MKLSIYDLIEESIREKKKKKHCICLLIKFFFVMPDHGISQWVIALVFPFLILIGGYLFGRI